MRPSTHSSRKIHNPDQAQQIHAMLPVRPATRPATSGQKKPENQPARETPVRGRTQATA
jgi:hypothetical protein